MRSLEFHYFASKRMYLKEPAGFWVYRDSDQHAKYRQANSWRWHKDLYRKCSKKPD